MKKLYLSVCQFCSLAVAPIANVWGRIYLGYFVFFVSGLAKLEDFEGTIELFEDDFALPFLSAEPAAYLATIGELVLPVLLILGLFTRFAAAGLFVMSAVIQIWVLQDHQHYFWMIILAMVIGTGGNRLSLDYWLLKDR